MPKLRLVLEIEAPEDVPTLEWTAAVRAFNEVAEDLMGLAEEGKGQGYRISCDVEPFMSLTSPVTRDRSPRWEKEERS